MMIKLLMMIMVVVVVMMAENWRRHKYESFETAFFIPFSLRQIEKHTTLFLSMCCVPFSFMSCFTLYIAHAILFSISWGFSFHLKVLFFFD